MRFSLFIVFLSFSESLATKCLFLNDETCMVRDRHTLIDMNPVELKYYLFMNVLSQKICVLKETKDIKIKAFNMIANKDVAKAMTEHISCDSKCKFNSSSTACD